MHSQRIHHEDMKPQNIIHRGERIYFTDFSSSRSFEAGQATSTANPARASRLFAAPEAFYPNDGTLVRHGSKTDVFSLGLVFVEMLTVLAGFDVDSLHDYLEDIKGSEGDVESQGINFSNWNHRQYHRVVHRFDEWFARLEKGVSTLPNSETVYNTTVRHYAQCGKGGATKC